MEETVSGETDVIWEALRGWYGNLVEWKLPGVSEGDLSEDS